MDRSCGVLGGDSALAWEVMKPHKDTPADYSLAKRHLGGFVVGASIFASNIGSEHLVGLTASAPLMA